MNADIETIKTLRQAYAVHGGTAASSTALARALRGAPLVSMSLAALRVKSSGAVYRLAEVVGFGPFLVCRYRGSGTWLPVFAAKESR